MISSVISFNSEKIDGSHKIFGAILAGLTSTSTFATFLSTCTTPNQSKFVLHQPPPSLLLLIPFLPYLLGISLPHPLPICFSYLLPGRTCKTIIGKSLSMFFSKYVTRTIFPSSCSNATSLSMETSTFYIEDSNSKSWILLLKCSSWEAADYQTEHVPMTIWG